MTMFEFTITTATQGFHVYKAIWENPVLGEVLKCRREVGNPHDSLAVAIIKLIDGEDTTVGHVPRRISGTCNAFIRRGGTIQCTVIGSRRYNVDLEQGGLEVPCYLRFVISSQEFCKKTETSVCSALLKTITFSLVSPTSKALEPIENQMDPAPVSNSGSVLSSSSPVKEPCSDVTFNKDNQTSSSQPVEVNSIVVEDVACSPPKKRQKKFNEEVIIMGEKLTDAEIQFAQRILKSQFPNINGLQSTLLQSRLQPCTVADLVNENKIQIVFCCGRQHWIVATTVGCETGEVKVYDSIFSSLDKETLRTIMKLFSSGNSMPRVRLSPSQKQTGSNDCGVFAICHAVAIAFGLNPSKLCLQQDRMRAHLVNCFNKELFSPFP